MSVSRHTYSIPIWPADQTTFWLKWTFWLRDSISDKNLLFVHERSETNPSSRVLTFEGEKDRNGLKHALAVGAAISQVLRGAPKNTNPRLWGPQTNPPLKKSGLLIDDRVQRFMSVEQMQSVHYLHQKIVLDAAEAQKQKPIFLSTSTICLFVGYLLASYIRTQHTYWLLLF